MTPELVSRRFHIGERHFAVYAVENHKNVLRDYFANLPLPTDTEVVEVTNAVTYSAAQTLRNEAELLGCSAPVERDGGDLWILPFSRVTLIARYRRREHGWLISTTGGEPRWCAPSGREIRLLLCRLLTDSHRAVPEGLGAVFWGLSAVALAFAVTVGVILFLM